MPEVVTEKPHILKRLHDTLARVGTRHADFRVEGGGVNPLTGRRRPHYIRVSTEVLDAATLEAVVAGHNALTLSVDRPRLPADDTTTALITCADPRLADDSAVTVTAWLDAVLYSRPQSVPVVAGRVQLSLKTALPGDYLIEVARQCPDAYDTGYISLTAEEDRS